MANTFASPFQVFTAAGAGATGISFGGVGSSPGVLSVVNASTGATVTLSTAPSVVEVSHGTYLMSVDPALVLAAGVDLVITMDAGGTVTPDNNRYVPILIALRAVVDRFGSLVGTLGTAQGGSNTTIQLAANASATNGQHVGASIRIVAGTGGGQVRSITAYVGSTVTATVDAAWATNPDATSVYVIEQSRVPAVDASGFVTYNNAAPPNAAANAAATAAAVLASPSNKLATSSTGGVELDLTQAIPTSNTAQTVGDALNAARAQGFGKWTYIGTTLTLYAADGSTVVRTFTTDSASAPTQRV